MTTIATETNFNMGNPLLESILKPIPSLSTVIADVGKKPATSTEGMQAILGSAAMSMTPGTGSVLTGLLDAGAKTMQVTTIIDTGDNSSEPVLDTYTDEYRNESFTKMNRRNTSKEEDFSDCYIGFIEKKDSPVRIVVESPSGETETVDQFFLTMVSQEMKEKMQVMSLLDNSDMIYFFGDSLVMITFAGICLDSKNFQWLQKLTYLYKNKMRGTLSTAFGYKIRVMYDDEMLTGVIINMTTTKTSASLNQAEVRFTMILTDRMSTSLGSDTTEVTNLKTNYTTDIFNSAEANIAKRTVSNMMNGISNMLPGTKTIFNMISGNTSSSGEQK